MSDRSSQCRAIIALTEASRAYIKLSRWVHSSSALTSSTSFLTSSTSCTSWLLILQDTAWTYEISYLLVGDTSRSPSTWTRMSFAHQILIQSSPPFPLLHPHFSLAPTYTQTLTLSTSLYSLTHLLTRSSENSMNNYSTTLSILKHSCQVN